MYPNICNVIVIGICFTPFRVVPLTAAPLLITVTAYHIYMDMSMPFSPSFLCCPGLRWPGLFCVHSRLLGAVFWVKIEISGCFLALASSGFPFFLGPSNAAGGPRLGRSAAVLRRGENRTNVYVYGMLTKPRSPVAPRRSGFAKSHNCAVFSVIAVFFCATIGGENHNYRSVMTTKSLCFLS